MVVEISERERGTAGDGLSLLAEAMLTIAAGVPRAEALAAVAGAALAATSADLVVVRTLDPASRTLIARAVAPPGTAVAAELEATRVAPEEVSAAEADRLDAVSGAARRAAQRAGASAVLQIPAVVAGRVAGCVELHRAGPPFDAAERQLGRIAAAQLALAVRTIPEEEAGAHGQLLDLAGEALAASADVDETARQIAHVAQRAAGAASALLWEVRESPRVLAGTGPEPNLPLQEILVRALAEQQPVSATGSGSSPVVTLRLGEPAVGALQLVFAGEAPSAELLARLQSFAVRAAHSFRSATRAVQLEQELGRTRALLEVVGETIARLSLTHTLETAVERIAALLGVQRVAVYLREDERLVTAAARGLESGHAAAARQLLDLAHGAFRARAAIVVDTRERDPAMASARAALTRSHLDSAVALPLRAGGESIGLLVAYPPAGRGLGENELTLLAALAAQLAVAVQNARLHEQATELGQALGTALESERQAARRLRAQLEISNSFAERMELRATLAAMVRTVVELLELDAAVVRLPDERGDVLVPGAVHVTPGPFEGAVRAILDRPHTAPLQRTTMLDAPTALRAGGAHALLAPFLERGATAAVVPIRKAGQLIASLTLLALDPGRPLDQQTVETARALISQASLALDNARLYEQLKDFSEKIQNSLLPSSEPDLAGIQVGAVYRSAATVEVGGDVYDFLELPDGRLAVVLGDVTGHGIDATADMAMAKYVFRSLAREHPEPGELLAYANDVVVREIALGKFITMAALVVEPATGRVSCASAGHPAPRLVRADGRVEALQAGGLALGIEEGMSYPEAEATLAPGEAVVLYTDGVIEARLERELYGVERLDATLAARRALPARRLAEAVLADCRAFGGQISDDTAVVVIKRTAVERPE